MKKLLLLAGLCAGLSSVMSAETTARTPVIYELFTSEGCSSCPPADRLLETLDSKQPYANVDLIVLSEHVDYWNNGGWADPFSSKLFTARQHRYAEQFGLESVYTPQRVVDGELEGVGSNAVGAKSDVEKAASELKIALTLSNISRNGRQLKFHAASNDPGAAGKQATFYVALAQDKVRSEVKSGENARRSLTHVAVVRTLLAVGSVKSGSAFSKDITVDLPATAGALNEGYRLVAFLQVDKTQKIIGATQSKL